MRSQLLWRALLGTAVPGCDARARLADGQTQRDAASAAFRQQAVCASAWLTERSRRQRHGQRNAGHSSRRARIAVSAPRWAALHASNERAGVDAGGTDSRSADAVRRENW